jgi:hypothetical protein
MSRPVVLGALVLLALAAVALAAPPARGAEWSWPVRGRVAVPFRLGASPFAAGQHRGIEIAARRGVPVRAACTGRVAFAGAVAAQGVVVAQACGGLTATYLRLAAPPAVRAGERVAAGRRIGVVGPAARLYFGVRRTARRFGYLDPLSLLPRSGAPERRPVLAPAPRRAPLGALVGPGPAPVVAPAPAAPPAPAGALSPRTHPAPGGALAARLGLLLAGLALPSWGGALIVARGRARRAARARAPASRTA